MYEVLRTQLRKQWPWTNFTKHSMHLLQSTFSQQVIQHKLKHFTSVYLQVPASGGLRTVTHILNSVHFLQSHHMTLALPSPALPWLYRDNEQNTHCLNNPLVREGTFQPLFTPFNWCKEPGGFIFPQLFRVPHIWLFQASCEKDEYRTELTG